MSSYNVVLLLGSNIGNTEQNLQNAIAKIENRIGNINKLSKMLETKPVEFVSNNIFRNIAMSLYTSISPFFLLTEIKNKSGIHGKTWAEISNIENVSRSGIRSKVFWRASKAASGLNSLLLDKCTLAR